MGDFRLRMLNIDLGARQVQRELLTPEVSAAFLGGRGTGACLLARSPQVSPLAPEAPLIFATGALSGSSVPASGRMVVSGFSPLTDTACSSSVGGRLALEMRKAGVDLILITGRSVSRVVVKIEDERVTFEEVDAGEDMPLSEFFARLRAWKGSVAAVGRAAFQGCTYASIMVDTSFSSGRGGLGTVMAHKNLRALCVRGSGTIPVRDPQGARQARTDILRLFDAAPAIMGRSGITHHGTATLVDLIASRRMMPTANFRRTYFDDYRAFSAFEIRRSQNPKHYACHGCPIACKQKAAREIPEYETLSHFGALNENSDLESIITANHICNEIGCDTITAASTIACLAEIRQQTYAGEALLAMMQALARGSGDGELLQLGAARLARELGAPALCMGVKSLELPAYDPRGAYGMALAYGTSTRGGCHLRAYPIAHEILRKPVATDRFSFSGKARIIKIAEDLNAVIDSIGACKFAFFGASLEEFAKGFSAVTGLGLDTQDLLAAGERIYTLERNLNVLRGFGPQDDLLPERFFREPGSSGEGIEVPPLDRDDYVQALGRYYRIRGLTAEGVPTGETLRRLGL